MPSYINYCAYFIPQQCLFGAYPTQDQIRELESWGVNLIIDLTKLDEKNIKKYQTNVDVVHFPISDNNIPENKEQFYNLVVYISKQIKDGKKIYIHCKGGHGRSGILVSALLCYIYNITPNESFKKTSEYHSTRPIHARRSKMNEFWKKKGSPQTKEQKQFIHDLFG
ncbi:MAG: protein-tyrosine phosphatase family protein [Enterobacter sp.]